MAAETLQNDRIRSLLVMLATAATIVFNALAATGFISGITPKEISDRYPTVLTPAGYAFSIWTLIYLCLAIFSVMQVLPRNYERFAGIRTLYIVTCVLNCGWIFFWHHDHPVICLFVIALLAATLVFLLVRSHSIGSRIVKMTFGLYAGWVTVAAMVNLFVVFDVIGMGQRTDLLTVLGVIAIVIASAIGLYVALKLKNYIYPLAVAWALTAIAINQGANTAIVVACAIGVIVTLLAALSFVIYLPLSNIPRGGDEQR
ncbi:MAG TPA: TspO/MBR family protein [Pyrinomonadaceae bacterium]|jgi:tryptophan-rich sensory protein